MNTPAPKPVLSIQYLRALAALGVTAFHQMESGGHPFPIGAAGVDVFFVISGFVMFLITEKRERDPAGFLRRRLIRICPLYWCATLLTVASCSLWPGLIWDADLGGRHLLASLLFLPHLGHARATHVTDPDWPMPTLPQGWTINLEMFFYLLMTLALLLPRRLQLWLLSLLLLGLAAIGAVLPPHSVGSLAYTYTSTALAEFAAGLWLGHLWLENRLPQRKTGLILLAAGIFCLGLAQMRGIRAEALRPNLPAMMIVLGALSLEAKGGIPRLPRLKLLGDASYSIYLFHIFLVPAIGALSLPYPLSLGAGLAASALAGVALFRWIEQPMLTALHRLPPWHFSRRKTLW